MLMVIRRTGVKRAVRDSIRCATAAAAIGPIERGCEIYGLTGGQFSLIDVIDHCLAATGPADVVISTWTAAGADVDFAMALLADRRIDRLRFIVDCSFPNRQPAYCAALRERFGEDAIRMTKSHCKFVTIVGDGWHLSVRTSMNLNLNRRLENFEISDSKPLTDHLLAFTDELFAATTGAAQFGRTQGSLARDFYSLSGVDAQEAEQLARSDQLTFFGEGATTRDLRRAGLSTSKGAKLL